MFDHISFSTEGNYVSAAQIDYGLLNGKVRQNWYIMAKNRHPRPRPLETEPKPGAATYLAPGLPTFPLCHCAYSLIHAVPDVLPSHEGLERLAAATTWLVKAWS